MIASQMTHFLSPSRLSNSTLDTFSTSMFEKPLLAFIWILLLNLNFILFVYILGVQCASFTSGADLNDFKTEGWWYTESSAIGRSLLHKPSGLDIGNFLMHTKVSTGATQIRQYFYVGGNLIYMRGFYSTSWSDWSEISTNIPSFYKNYNSISALYSAIEAAGATSYSSKILEANTENKICKVTQSRPCIIVCNDSGLSGIVAVLAYSTTDNCKCNVVVDLHDNLTRMSSIVLENGEYYYCITPENRRTSFSYRVITL